MAEVIGGNHIMAPLPERMTPRQSAPLARELAPPDRRKGPTAGVRPSGIHHRLA
jgi:hypothetical protein